MNRRIIVINFEVLTKAGVWICCMKDYATKKRCIIANDAKKFTKVFMANKDAIWIGYNIKGYAQYIMKSLLSGVSPFVVSDAIIKEKRNGWEIDMRLNKVRINLFEIAKKDKSLEELTLFMGEEVRENKISFDLDRYPTNSEMDELIKYCEHDVNMACRVFEETKEEFDSHTDIIEMFGYGNEMFSKTQSQLASKVLNAKKPLISRNDDMAFEILDIFDIRKYKEVVEWYKNPNNMDYSKSTTCMVYGVKCSFGWGGAHGALKQYKSEGYLVNSDGESYYPTLQIEHNFLSRNVSEPKRYEAIKLKRVQLKDLGDKRQVSMKRLLNIVFGATKDVNSELYDPRRSNEICVNGQLMLLDLIEMTEVKFGNRVKLVQINTDGVMFDFKYKEDVIEYKTMCEKWVARMHIILKHDDIKRVVQKDVNNYIVVFEDGKVKSVGAYVKELSPIDYDLPIVNEAIREYFVNGTAVEETIGNCDELIKFQKNIKKGSAYKGLRLGNVVLENNVVRVFAANRGEGKTLLKIRAKDDRLERVALISDSVIIYNRNIHGMSVPECLDKQWYIELAKRRVDEFIPKQEYEYTLFDMLG